MVTKVKYCRICHSKNIKPFLDLGPMPLPNGFLKVDQLQKHEPTYPLSVGICLDCGLVQLVDIVSAEVMFKNYVYIPSASRTRIENFRQIVNQIISHYKPMKNALAVDIGSNDGSMLVEMKLMGLRTLGVDPAENLAIIAELKGIKTKTGYFSYALSKNIRKGDGPAWYITATNVVAHVDDLHDFFKGIHTLLHKKGVFLCEFPYLVDLVDKKLFDTIYQEHLSYFSVKPLLKIIGEHELKIIDIQRTPIDGGALRIVMARIDSPYKEATESINKLLLLEEEKDIYSISRYRKFSKDVNRLRKEIKQALQKLKKRKKSIAGYGAAARGNILMNYCLVGKKYLDFIVDSTPYKQGLYTPGTHLQIVSEEEILASQPDYVLILAWNFAQEIMKKQQRYSRKGGKFIIPVPNVQII